MKQQIPIFVATIAGLVPIVSSIVSTPGNRLQAGNDWFEQSLIIIFAFALLLGVVNVFQTNLRKIYERRKGWPYAVVLLGCLVGTAIPGIHQAFAGIDGTWQVGDDTAFEWIQNAVFKPLQGTMFSLLAFYIASAAFRAFRVRNVEATILLSAAMVVMLGVNPYGIKLFAWMPSIGAIPGGEEFLPAVTNWVMNVPNSAAQRGIIIGAALGAAAMSLRVLLGIERSYLGVGRD